MIGRAESGDGSPESLYGQIDQVDTDISHNGDDAWHLVAGTSDSYTLVDAAIGDAGDDPGSYFTIVAMHKHVQTAAGLKKLLVKMAPILGNISWYRC